MDDYSPYLPNKALPIVSVVMPAYNCEKYIAEAIESILNQTFKDFEFLIINDGSTDKTEEIIKSYNDPRILYIKNQSNIKLISTLNKGISLAKGKYIVRMDADDISLPSRIEDQLFFMEKNPSIGLGGTFIRIIGLDNNYNIPYSVTNDEIKFRLFFDTHFPHPAAIIRKQVLTDNGLLFEHKYIHCEDFALWNKIAKVSKLAIIPKTLVLKRSHEDQVSVKYLSIQKKISSDIRKELISVFVPNISDDLMEAYDNFFRGIAPANPKLVFDLLDLFNDLILANRTLKIYNKELFEKQFKLAIWNLCLSSTQYGFAIYKKFSGSICGNDPSFSSMSNIKLLCKALFHFKDTRIQLPVIIE